MGKDSKKATDKADKSITDFFTRKIPAAHQLKLSTSQGGQCQPLIKPPRLQKPVVSVSSDPSISVSSWNRSVLDAFSSPSKRSRTFMEAVEIVSPPRVAKAQNGSQYLQLPSNTPLKRPHSSHTQNIALRSPRSPRHGVKSPVGTPRSRKSKFDSDSDHDKPDSVVYLSKSVRPVSACSLPVQVAPFSPKENLTYLSQQIKSDPKKKPRLSSPEQSLCEDFVPGSQSDEWDMIPQLAYPTHPQIATQNIGGWLQSVSLPSAEVPNNGFDGMHMDVDADISSSPSFMGSTSSTLPTSVHEDTPPPANRTSSLSPLPASPMVLDEGARSAQIIADIKAKAYAASMDSPLDSPPVQFKEELDDSSDEEDLFSFSPTNGKGKSISKIELPELKPPSVPPPRRSGRFAPCNRGHSPSPSTAKRCSSPSSTSRPACAISTCVAPTQARGKKQSKAKVYDPLEELLKEKRLADKRGKGDEAFRLAEVALAGKDALLEEMNEEDWSNEDAARMAVRERMEMKSSPATNNTSNDETTLGPEDKQRLFGEERGKAIENILYGDRTKKQKEKENEKVFGVPLWLEGIPTLDQMAIDNVVPMLELKGSHPILQLVKAVVDRREFAQAALLVDSGAIASIHFTENPSVVPYFCELALSCQEGPLNASSFRFLRHIWDNSSRPVPGISFECILSCLLRVGARPCVLESLGWTPVPGLRHETATVQKRDEILYRLVALLTSSARSHTLSNEEVPDILMAMLLIANEPSSSAELQREIMLAVDEVCQSIASGADISASLESTICTRVLNYVSTLKPINKAYIVSVLEGGSGRTRRLARWIAHSIITDKLTVAAKFYNDLPPLPPVHDQLAGRSYDKDVGTTPGKLEIHEDTDYVDMGFYVQILAVALSNVMAYVAKERKAPRPRPSAPGSPSSSDRHQPETMLELIITSTLVLHGRISDTRAAHLERSRTKAALYGVAMRVHYQRLAGLRSATDGTGKPRNLLQYFTPNS